jgi:hypothetical protein
MWSSCNDRHMGVDGTLACETLLQVSWYWPWFYGMVISFHTCSKWSTLIHNYNGMQWQTNRYNSWTKEIVPLLQQKHYKRVIRVQRPPTSYDHIGNVAYASSPLVWSCLGDVSLSVLQLVRDPVTVWSYISNQCDGAADTILSDYLG